MPPIANPDIYPGIPGTTLYAGIATPGVGVEVARLYLANETVSEQPANSIAPMFGVMFKQGEVLPGRTVAFETLGGVPCPATVMMVNNWPDGSMRRCSVLMRVPVSVPAGEELTVICNSTTTSTGASARANSDVTGADLAIDFIGVSGLTGAWSGSLNTALTDALDVAVYGDGPAGRVLRIGGFAKQGGTAHPHLYCWQYVQLLQDASGGLAGVRHLGRFGLPFCDVAGANRITANVALKSGATTLRTLIGHDTTETPGANIGIDQYSSGFTCGTSARFDFIAGTQAAECVLRVKHDKAGFVRSKVIPSYDTVMTTSAGTPRDYVPYCRGAAVRAMGGTGERADIGVFPDWAVKHLQNQSATDDQIARVTGLASAGWRTLFRESANRQPATFVDIEASYSGLSPARTTGRTFPANNEWGNISVPASPACNGPGGTMPRLTCHSQPM